MKTKERQGGPAVEDASKNTGQTKIRIFLNYAIPSIIAMWIFSIYTMVDGIFVANYVGPSALAAVNIAMPAMNLIFAISLLLTTGVSTIIAIDFGKGNIRKARELFTLNTIVLIVISILITVTGILNLDSLSLFLGATPNTGAMVKAYLKIILLFAVFFVVSYQFEVLVKTDGSPRLAAIGVITSALTNIVLDYIFIVNLGWGVKGAALATGISQVASTVIFSIYFFSKKSKLSFVKIKFEFCKIKIYQRIASLGISDSMTELSAGIIVFVFNQTILKIIGEQGVVTYTIISYANLLVLMTMIGITQGMQPLVSYYFGKGDYKTYSYFFKVSIFMAFICVLPIMYMSFLKTEYIIRAFIGNEDIHMIMYSIRAFRAYSLSFVIVGFNIIISGFFVALEKPFQAIFISLLRGLFVPVLVLEFITGLMGASGIWIAMFISELIVLIVSIFFYCNYKKSEKQIRKKFCTKSV